MELTATLVHAPGSSRRPAPLRAGLAAPLDLYLSDPFLDGLSSSSRKNPALKVSLPVRMRPRGLSALS